MHFGNAYIFQRKMFSNAYIFQKKMFSKTKCTHLCFLQSKKHSIFAKQNVTNAFDALPKCILASNAFDAALTFCESGKMHFGVHFPKENVQRTFSKGKCSAYIFQRKMFSNATRTFDFVKCSASHFAKQNVQQKVKKQSKAKNKDALLCKNTFLHQIHFCIKYIFASNTFLHQIYFCIKYIFASHFV